MAWQQLTLTTTAEHAEALADFLQEQDALSISFRDAADEPLFQLLPEATPLWARTQVIALFSEEQDLTPITTELQRLFKHALAHLQISTLAEQDWVRQTQKQFPPQCFAEKLWVIPSWCNPTLYGDHRVILDPGLAFGTGTHPTTALCLEWLATHPPTDLTVIDYGCGSGILSLAALALGAKTVYAVDHDPQALEATQSNRAANSFSPTALCVFLPEALPKKRVPLLIANILAEPLITLAPILSALTEPPATLLLSGLLITEIDAVANAYAHDFYVVSARTKEEWAQLTLRSRA